MAERNNKLEEISNQLDENILAVKGTLELVDTSVVEDELHELLLKALERMDIIQRLSEDMLIVLKNCFDKIGEMKK
jgi:DNA-binding FrmR family transcriptional regulator